MTWKEAERKMKALMEKHGYQTADEETTRIKWDGEEHLLGLKCVQYVNIKDIGRTQEKVTLGVEAYIRERKNKRLTLRESRQLSEECRRAEGLMKEVEESRLTFIRHFT